MNEHLIPGETVEDYENKNEQALGIIGDIGMYDNRPEKIHNTGEINRQMMAILDGKVYRWDNNNITSSEITGEDGGVLSYDITITVSASDEVKEEEK